MLRRFFSYVPSDSPPEVPEVEPPDPAIDRALSEAYRAARRSLVGLCAVCFAWSTAQFGLDDLSVDAVGVSVDLTNASVPLLLGIGMSYLTCRWVLEFAMMPRLVRRWRLAQLDFRLVSGLARFSLLTITAGALDRSLGTVAVLVVLLGGLALVLGILITALMFLTMPIRMWARERANVPSAASASGEALAWAVVFALSLIMLGTIAFGAATYRYEPLRTAIWPVPPSPIAFSVFLFTINATFLSPWLLRPVFQRLFAERPPYRTRRTADGRLQVTFVDEEKEPLL